MSLAWAAGEKLTAAKMNIRNPLYVDKSAGPQSVTSSTTYVDDTALVLTLPPNRTYEIFCQLSVTGSDAGDIKVQWSTTGDVAAVVERANRGPTINTTNISGSAAASISGGVNRASSGVSLGAASTSYGLASDIAADVVEQFVVSTGPLGGNLQLRWAQRVSNATSTIVGISSFLRATPVA